MARRTRLLSRINVCRLEDRCTPASVGWDGDGGDLMWSNPANWTNNTVPGLLDDATVSAAGTVIANGPVTISSLTLSNPLTVTGGALTISGSFTAIGQRVEATGIGSAFSAPGTIAADGASFFASAGGSVALAGLASYSGGTMQPRFRADGAGSVIGLPNLTSLNGSTIDSTFFESINGGTLNAPNLTTFTGAFPTINATGVGSVVDVPALTTITASNAGFISATFGGQALITSVTQLDRMNLTVDGASTLPTTQLTKLTRGGVTATNVQPDLSNVTDISGTSLTANGGAKITLSNYVSYNALDANAVLRADGAGSVLSLPNLTTLKGSTAFFLQLQAAGGGLVSIPNVTSLDVGYFSMAAEGPGSILNLNGVTQITHASTFSFLSATGGGTVTAPTLTSLVNVNLTVDAASTFPTSQLVSLQGGSVVVHGGTRSLDALTTAKSLAFTADLGASVSLPALTSYDGANGAPGFTADGANSRLDMPNLNTLTSASFFFTKLHASNGGTVSAPSLAQITTGFPDLIAMGANSVLDLPGLAQLSAGSGNFGFLTVSNGGKLTSAASLVLDRVTARIDPTSQFTLTSLNLANNSVLYGDGTLNANVTNAAEVRPGASGAGTLTVDGNYTQTAIGQLTIEVGGAGSGQYDHFSITGSAALAGTARVNLIGGYVPSLGGHFIPLTFAAKTSGFDTFAGLNVGNNVKFQVDAQSTEMALDVVFASGVAVGSASPAGTISGSFDHVDVTFSSAIDAGSVSVADVSLTGPGGAINPSGATAISANVVRITFPSQSGLGTYSLNVGPNITDLFGNAMNQNNNALNGETSDGYSDDIIIVDVTAPTVGVFDVNGGVTQRSQVTEIKITFSEQVFFPPNPGDAFVLKRIAPGAPVQVPLPNPTISQLPGGQTVVRFIGPSAEDGILVDGDYIIIVPSGKLLDAGANPLNGGGDVVVGSVHRLYGDLNGNRTVDLGDYGAFRPAFGKAVGDAGYVSALDDTNNGQIDLTDFGHFRLNFGFQF